MKTLNETYHLEDIAVDEKKLSFGILNNRKHIVSDTASVFSSGNGRETP
jgi:hypothetical protein